MSLAEVTTIYPSNFRQVPEMLRKLADCIDAGDYGDVGCVAVSMLGDKLYVFGWGVDSESPSVHLMLTAGAQYLAQGILDHGKT